MHSALATLIDRLDSPAVLETEVIPWGSPVPSFGDLSISRVATLGLNPSNREFVDESGGELQGPLRRRSGGRREGGGCRRRAAFPLQLPIPGTGGA